ncbi:MAG TPA: peptidoglycan editing factor PgeF [Methylophilaceae bacterium]
MKMLNNHSFITPNWPAPASVKSLQTTRVGGKSIAPYDSLNLGGHVGDEPLTVAANRQLLNQYVPSEPLWLNQVHGLEVVNAHEASCLPCADASYTDRKGVVCAVMTADCLPVLLCNTSGTEVAAIHAGWKGLLDGVIEAGVAKMKSPANEIMAWFGPAIGPDAFEVGDDVRDAFIEHHAEAAQAFTKLISNNSEERKWLGNIYQLATQRLHNKGVKQIYGGGLCTYTDTSQFFSFRRDGATGRMATLIWLD